VLVVSTADLIPLLFDAATQSDVQLELGRDPGTRNSPGSQRTRRTGKSGTHPPGTPSLDASSSTNRTRSSTTNPDSQAVSISYSDRDFRCKNSAGRPSVACSQRCRSVKPVHATCSSRGTPGGQSSLNLQRRLMTLTAAAQHLPPASVFTRTFTNSISPHSTRTSSEPGTSLPKPFNADAVTTPRFPASTTPSVR